MSAELIVEAADWPLLAFAVRRLRRDQELMLPRGVREHLADLDERLVRAAVTAQTGVTDSAADPQHDHRHRDGYTITVTEAAARMGCSTRYVRKLISLGRLPARRTSAGWLVMLPDAEPDSGAA